MNNEKGINKITRRKALVGLGIGAFVTSIIAVLGYCGFFGTWKKENSNTVELTFSGPITSRKQLIDQPIENSWLRVQEVRCTENIFQMKEVPDHFSLRYSFNDPRIEKSGVSSYKIHSKVIITDKNGNTNDMIDEITEYRQIFVEIAGRGTSNPLSRAGIRLLPCKISDIARIQVQFTRVDDSTTR
jgi:hypothetical protein